MQECWLGEKYVHTAAYIVFNLQPIVHVFVISLLSFQMTRYHSFRTSRFSALNASWVKYTVATYSSLLIYAHMQSGFL